MRIRPLSLFAFTALASGCGTSPTTDMAVPPDMAQHDIALPTEDLTPENFADLGPIVPPATTAVIATGDFVGKTGTLATVGLADDKVTKNIDTIPSGNSSIHAVNGKVVWFDDDHNVARFYDPAKGYKDPIEVKLPAMSNAHEIVAVPASSKFYVTLYGNTADSAIGVIDLMPPVDGGFGTPALVKTIAIPQAAKDPDGIPEANNIYACGSFAYVSTQDLDESKGFAPTGPGRIVAIDFTKDAVDASGANMGVIQLLGQNPNAIALDGAAGATGCDVVLVADASNQFADVDGTGGIERVDLTGRASKGMAIKDTDLGGHPYTVSSASKTLSFATLTVMSGAGSQSVAFDPTAGKLKGAVSPVAGYIAFTAVAPAGGSLFIGVGTAGANATPPVGLFIGKADGSMVGAMPIDLGQSPGSIAFF